MGRRVPEAWKRRDLEAAARDGREPEAAIGHGRKRTAHIVGIQAGDHHLLSRIGELGGDIVAVVIAFAGTIPDALSACTKML